ncbi:MAG: lytic transglycosylase domain-containing protein [Lachnospiraceae bacterium]|nr:lytic transglycosylase domain-containing protein [Lachnospiraceae bacterium]
MKRLKILSSVLLLTTFSLIAVTAAEHTKEPTIKENKAQIVERKTAAVEPETIEEVAAAPEKILDIPMDAIMQHWIFTCCESDGIDPFLIIAIIDTESSFNPKAQNGTCLGMMQINADVHQGLLEAMGGNDFYNPYQNITVGMKLIKAYLDTGKGLDWALMAYNGGRTYADEKTEKGEVTDYVYVVKEKIKEYKEAADL